MRILKVILSALLLLLIPLSGCISEPPEEEQTFHGTKWMGTEYAPLFTLESMDGNNNADWPLQQNF